MMQLFSVSSSCAHKLQVHDTSQWVIVDLVGIFPVCGIVTQGWSKSKAQLNSHFQQTLSDVMSLESCYQLLIAFQQTSIPTFMSIPNATLQMQEVVVMTFGL
jgi:hypothetical protein